MASTSQELNTKTWVRAELHICSVPRSFDDTPLCDTDLSES